MTTGTIIALYLSAFPVFAAGYLFLSYGPYAAYRGWRAGYLFQSGDLATPGLLLMLASVAFPVMHHSWWALVIVPVLGHTLAYVLTQAFQSGVQILSLLMAIGGSAAYFICLNCVQ